MRARYLTTEMFLCSQQKHKLKFIKINLVKYNTNDHILKKGKAFKSILSAAFQF